MHLNCFQFQNEPKISKNAERKKNVYSMLNPRGFNRGRSTWIPCGFARTF